MKHPVVLVNARAGRVARDPDLADRLRAQLPPENVWVSHAAEGLLPALRDARDARVDTLVLVGGDGSLPSLLTPLLRVWPHHALPAIALIGGGSTSALARALGTRGSPEAVLERLLAAPATLPVTRLRVLDIRPAGRDGLYGLGLAAGLPARWLERTAAGPGRGPLGTLACAAAALGDLSLRSAAGRRLSEPLDVELRVDGQRVECTPITGVHATSLAALALAGGTDADGAGERIHVRVCLAGAARAGLGLALARLTAGARAPAALASIERRAGRLLEIGFAKRTPFAIDTEPFPPTSRLGVGLGPQLRFLRI